MCNNILFFGTVMPISLKLPQIDNNPILLAETRPPKIKTFIQNLPLNEPIRAANNLIEELRIINSQQVSVANRLNALELYRPVGLSIYQRLLPQFSHARLPISKKEQEFALASSQLCQEFALGYKCALVDFQNKILSINSVKITALIIQRAIHACSEIALINHLAYTTLPALLWAELHQLYYIALQQSADLVTINDDNATNKLSSASIIYTQTLLLALVNPQHLANKDTLIASKYLANVCSHAQLRPLGFIASPAGVFLVSLDSNNPPIPFVKNKAIPDNATDILLVTLNLARLIHRHIKLLQDKILPDGDCVPENAIEIHFIDLLKHLIKQFGKTPQRVFSRVKKSEGIELGIGIDAAHHLLAKNKREFDKLPIDIEINIDKNNLFKISRWHILNVSAGGYALRKFNSSVANAQIGDLVTVKNNRTNACELAVLRWANFNEIQQLDVGLELISPGVSTAIVKTKGTFPGTQALLLPELITLKQAASIIAPVGVLKIGQPIQMHANDKHTNIMPTQLIERTASYERYQYCLILSN